MTNIFYPSMIKEAIFSEDRKYRYSLSRIWDSTKPYVLFIGLNPSTADEHLDDHTIRRCKGFALEWGYGGIYMANLFGLRSTDPKVMLKSDSPVGTGNDEILKKLGQEADVIVCVWGNPGDHLNREYFIKHMFRGYSLKCLGLTKGGHPKHPLRLRCDTPLQDFE